MQSEVFPTAQISLSEEPSSRAPLGRWPSLSLPTPWFGWGCGFFPKTRQPTHTSPAHAHFPKALRGSALPTGLRASSFKALDSFLYVPLHETSTLTLTACPSFTKGHSAHPHSHLPPMLPVLIPEPLPHTFHSSTDSPSSLCSALKIPSSIHLCLHSAATPRMPAVIVTDVSECLCVPISFLYHLILKTTMWSKNHPHFIYELKETQGFQPRSVEFWSQDFSSLPFAFLQDVIYVSHHVIPSSFGLELPFFLMRGERMR